ncbi:MAG: dihydrodipicolinate synthase family protein, partial [Rhizobiales bacterium]|nr:dihydrodipicolinate synthase family protein [Hyphomicrobiales bacterium]
MTEHRFHGIYPMLYAFFDETGALDRGAAARQVEGCISGGVHGLAVGGLATECGKLSSAEKRQLCLWVLEVTSGRVPVSVTISEASADAQIEMALLAADNGAQWVVLQPPPVKEISEVDLIAFFGKVADACPVPVGIQNAPQFIGIGLSNWGLIELNKRHPNVSILKAEGDAMYSAALAKEACG